MEFRIEGLCKRYPNGVQALQDVSLNLPLGMFRPLGPNGAGKSLDGIDILRQKRTRCAASSVICPRSLVYIRKCRRRLTHAASSPLVHVLTFFDKPNFRRWQLVTRPRPGNVQRRQQDHADEQLYNQSADNHDSEWALRIRSNVV
jgi:hypothetical protein